MHICIRYVGEFFAIFTTNSGTTNSFLSILNTCFPSIKFTVELESNEQLPFYLVNQQLEFDILRKPTHTSRYIKTSSNYCSQQKSINLNLLLQRFLIGKIRYNHEFKMLNKIGNGFSARMVDQTIKKFRLKFLVSSSSVFTGDKFWTLVSVNGSSSRLHPRISEARLYYCFQLR